MIFSRLFIEKAATYLFSHAEEIEYALKYE